MNAGATVFGARPRTKKDLRAALAATPDAVEFDPTDVFYTGPLLRADRLPEGVSVRVCGPDPYTRRRWFTQVTGGADGPTMT